MSITKTGRGCVPVAEADDARRRGKGIRRLYDWGVKGIGRGGRNAGYGTNRVELTIL